MQEIGRVYGRLTVIEKTSRTNTQGRYFYTCQCVCGAVKDILINSLRNGLTKSCGCLSSETVAKRNKDNATHGLRNSVEYRVWASMLERCRNPKCQSYSSCGAKGITVCDRWKEFTNFYTDVGKRPSNKYNIGRADPLGNYTPENCSWVPKLEAVNNRANTVKLMHDGELKPISVIARIIGVNRDTLLHRVKSNILTESLFSKTTYNGFTFGRLATFYIYESVDFIGFGITTNFKQRNATHQRNTLATGRDLRLLNKYEMDSLLAVELEREIKSIFADKIIDANITGFKTEALPLKYKEGIINIVEILLKQGI